MSKSTPVKIPGRKKFKVSLKDWTGLESEELNDLADEAEAVADKIRDLDVRFNEAVMKAAASVIQELFEGEGASIDVFPRLKKDGELQFVLLANSFYEVFENVRDMRCPELTVDPKEMIDSIYCASPKDRARVRKIAKAMHDYADYIEKHAEKTTE